MSEKKFEKAARKWLVDGGNGHEGGEAGIWALTLSGESLVEYLAEYAEYLSEKSAAPKMAELLKRWLDISTDGIEESEVEAVLKEAGVL